MNLTKAQADIINDLLNDEPLYGLQYRRVAVNNLIRLGLARWILVNWQWSTNSDGDTSKIYFSDDTVAEYVELTEKAKEIYS